jgi:hypothetical protein
VHNAEGKTVQQYDVADGTEWDASHLSNGVYFLTITLQGGGIGRQKIVVQH